MPRAVRPYIRRRYYDRRQLRGAHPAGGKRVPQPHLKAVREWEIEEDEAALLDKNGKVVDTLHLGGLVDEWLAEAKRKKWVSYNPDNMEVEWDGDEAVIVDPRNGYASVDRINLDSLIEEWLREQGGWRY